MLKTLGKSDAQHQNLLWEDKQVKFDSPQHHTRLRSGEKLLDTIYHIEDSKGNPGDTGKLLVTNLRIIWHSLVHKKFNLSIGYARIGNTNTRLVHMHTKGRMPSQALYILALSNETRFEFLFTDVSGETARRDQPIFASVFDVHLLYQRTFLYRDLKLRGAIVQAGQLIILPDEQVYSQVQGVWNLSSDQGNLGCFVVTNVRLVWYADANETFNISLPYLQIDSVRIRESKYGPALVIQTAETGGGYVLGFRIDPVERLNELFKELCSLHTIYTEQPNFGINYDPHDARQRVAAAAEEAAQATQFKIDDYQEMDERQEREINTKLNNYLADGCLGVLASDSEPTREPIYCKELGFAMERIPDGYKLQDLWQVLPTKMATYDE
ncbi:Bardet-Biedl syndrome 5 protein homolog isoform X1 [Drosophila nasuta]|uniref:BBSome complex member BBS5 n=1 Tax=Drosophila albomicans TaxID=7291 RepID=A0A6P8XBP1_DROAB|nr:Bardet-Biedl syndrome 5 protein homolog isoform X1 [Drosophila albomicans]XP_060646439.1 Bardet-Biedl syndrome 5 protein homolog isoform X1 [Drosophila nasuta]